MTDAPFVSESRFRARSYELDSFDHVNHAVFLNWFEQARFDALEGGGFPAHELARSGWAVVVVRVEVEYHAEVKLGDEVVVRTRAEELRNTSMTLGQQAFLAPGRTEPDGQARSGRDDEVLAAEGRVVVVWLREGRPARIPEAVREALSNREDPSA